MGRGKAIPVFLIVRSLNWPKENIKINSFLQIEESPVFISQV